MLLLGLLAWALAGCVAVPAAVPTSKTRTSALAAPVLVKVRSWSRPSSRGQRVRIGARGGRLALAWAEPLGGTQRRVVLEDQAGSVLWQRAATWRPGLGEFYGVSIVGGQVLYRDGDALRLGDELVGAGSWEAYAGHAGGSGASVLGWAACPGRPCPAAALWRAPARWQSNPWNRELFGVALSRASTGTVAVASRENPANAGWTLRRVDEAALLRGVVAEMQPAQTWRPPAGLSFEDPGLVEGAARPMLLGEAFNVLAGKSSGRVFLAESGERLREVLAVAPTAGNVEIAGVVSGGVLYVAAELAVDRSGLWAWTGGRLVQVGEVQGSGPWLGLAEGGAWLSTSAGLWRIE